MGLLRNLLILTYLPLVLRIQAQSSETSNTSSSLSPSSSLSARSLDGLLQDYAYRVLNQPRTGTPYDGTVPSNLTGIKITSMRLRSGSLYTKGIKSFKEFIIPTGIIEKPYVKRLVLVYQNLGNWSSVYYPLPGYTYLYPVLGLLAYDGSNLSATNLPELNIKVSDKQKPILIKFEDMKLVPSGSTPMCVSFGLEGTPKFSNVSGNVCETLNQGHFSVVIKSIAPSPKNGSGKEKDKKRVWMIVGSVIGGLVLLVLLCFLLVCVRRYKHRKKIQEMENEAEVGESLQMTSIRDTRAPVALGTRTQPVLEHGYVP